jgi:hypothetical protein
MVLGPHIIEIAGLGRYRRARGRRGREGGAEDARGALEIDLRGDVDLAEVCRLENRRELVLRRRVD